MSANILLISVDTLKQRTAVHDNIDEKLIYPEIKAAQDLYIHPILGTALYNKILTDISNNALAGNYKVLVDSYLIDTLCWYVVSELPVSLNYQFWNKGVGVATSDNTNAPSMSELFDLVSKYKNRAEAYQKKAIFYLKQNAPNLFPEYLNPGTGIDTVLPDRVGYSSPIFLGDEVGGKMSYKDKYQGNIFRHCNDC
jgi:hypothetical protein